MTIKFIDLFSGIGGFRLAFENQGAKCVFGSEIDEHARDTYKINFGNYPAGDITKIDSSAIPDFDILCAGFPCQPFSIGGLRKGFEDSRGTLFFEVARILRDKKPKAFILENVRGITNHDSGNTIDTIRNILNSLGYNFKDKKINALNHGIPQNRDRWYCVGFRNDLDVNTNKLFQFPKNMELKYTLEDIIDNRKLLEYECSLRATQNINKHKKIWMQKNNINEDYFLIANDIRPSRCSFRNDGTSPCLTAKMGTGGNNVPVIVHLNRKFTEKECLKIMGFPDSFYIKPNHSQSYKQIGNSVILPIVEHLASEIIELIKPL